MNNVRWLRLNVKDILILMGRMVQVTFIMMIVVKMIGKNSFLSVRNGRDMEGCIVPMEKTR
jgi:hypothetical protein